MKKYPFIILASVIVASFLSTGAGVLNPEPQKKDLGIGPVKNVVLGPLNAKMAAAGKVLFTSKCALCHELDQKKIGPPLRNITKDSAPEYIMNLVLNSVQMQKEDPAVKELIKKYNNVIMPPPGLNQAQARSVLEYLRSVAK